MFKKDNGPEPTIFVNVKFETHQVEFMTNPEMCGKLQRIVTLTVMITSSVCKLNIK